MAKHFIQIFSMTDHPMALNGRFQGPYQGLNAELQTAEVRDKIIFLSNDARSKQGEILKEDFERANVVLCYRHSDTGVLQGTSEMLIPISKLPWTDMPGIEVRSATDSSATLKLWNQELDLKPTGVVRVHFMKTIVYLRFLGEIEGIKWTDEKLTNGPAHLHAEPLDQDLTIAPPGTSGLQVKMGQEVVE